MKKILKKYIELFLKEKYLNFENKSKIKIVFDSDRKPIELKIKKSKDGNGFEILNEYSDIDLLNLPIKESKIWIKKTDTGSISLKNLTVQEKFSIDNKPHIEIHPSLQVLDHSIDVDRIEPYKVTRLYGVGEYVSHKNKIYKCINTTFKGSFDENYWEEIKKLQDEWCLYFVLVDLPKVYTTSFVYKEGILIYHIYKSLCYHGNSILSYNRYNNAISYITNNIDRVLKEYKIKDSKTPHEILEKVLKKVTLNKLGNLRIRECATTVDVFYVIEKVHK